VLRNQGCKWLDELALLVCKRRVGREREGRESELLCFCKQKNIYNEIKSFNPANPSSSLPSLPTKQTYQKHTPGPQ